MLWQRVFIDNRSIILGHSEMYKPRTTSNFLLRASTVLILAGIFGGCASTREWFGFAARDPGHQMPPVGLSQGSSSSKITKDRLTISTASSGSKTVKDNLKATKLKVSNIWGKFWLPLRKSEIKSPPVEIVKQEHNFMTDENKIAFERARGLESENNWSGARKVYEKLAKINPQWWEAHHRLAVCADQQGSHREAEMAYRRALEIKPQDEKLLNDLGYCYYLQGEWKKAREILSSAVELDPNNPRICNNLGLVYGRLGNADEALATFRRVGSEEAAQHNLTVVMAGYEEESQSVDEPKGKKVSWEESLKKLYAEHPIETSRVPKATKLR